MRKTKPVAYIAPYQIGYFMMQPKIEWLAKNDYGNTVAWGSTRKECEKDCRLNGYVPVRDK